MTKDVTISWEGASGQTFFITLDVAAKVQHTSTNQVTDHPVEIGSNVSDHIRPDPNVLTIEGVISNTPLFLPSDHIGNATLTTLTVAADWSGLDNRDTVRGRENTIGDYLPVPRLVGGIAVGGEQIAHIGRDVPGQFLAANVLAFDSEFDRAGECFAELQLIRDTGILCFVQTHRRVYEDMAVTQLDVADDGTTGHALRFNIAFKQVRYGQTRTEPVPAVPRKRKPVGKKQPTPPPVEPEGRGSIFGRSGH